MVSEMEGSVDRFGIGLCAGVLGVLMAGASAAQQTQIYAYDVHGRLIATSRENGADVRSTTYGLDKADNRTSRVIEAAPAARSAATAQAPSEASAPPSEGNNAPTPPQQNSSGSRQSGAPL